MEDLKLENEDAGEKYEVYQNYCTNFISTKLEDTLLLDILSKLHYFDGRTRALKPNMAKARRRLCFGFNETKRQLSKLGRKPSVVGIIIAKDLNDSTITDDDFQLVSRAKGIPVIYALTGRQLGNALLAPAAKIACVAVLRLDGVHESWNEVLSEFALLHSLWSMRCLQLSIRDLILYSSYYGHCELLEKGLKSVECVPLSEVNSVALGYVGKSPLIFAAEHGYCDVVKVLLSHSADEDIPDFTLSRPLHYGKNVDVVKVLKYHEKRNANGFSPIETAILSNRVAVAKYFLDDCDVKISPKQLIFLAARLKTCEMLSFLWKKFRNHLDYSEILDESGNNLLMVSVLNSSYEVFKYVLAELHGKAAMPMLSCRNLRNEDVFDIAANLENSGISRKLLKMKAESRVKQAFSSDAK